MITNEDILQRAHEKYSYQPLFYTPTEDELEDWLRTRRQGATTVAECITIAYSLYNHFVCKAAGIELLEAEHGKS